MFKVVWDKEYNGVRLTQSPQGEALNVSPRPVFFEELDFLKMEDYGWKYPRCIEPLLWACERRYFYRGELVLEVHGGNIFDAPSVEPKVKKLALEPVDMERLRDRNEDAMFIIEHEAMNFIDETYHRYRSMARVSEKNPDIDFQQLAERQTKQSKEEHVVVKEDCDSFDIMPLSEAERQGKKPVLSGSVEMFISSFSGGKDSAVVLDLVSRVVPPEDFLVIYSDTGYELPTSLELYEEVQKYYHATQPDIRFYTARNHQTVLYYWDQMGSPSRIHRWCCAVMKSAPLSKLLKEIAGSDKQPHALLFDGVRAEESAVRASRSRIGKNVKHNGIINARPILDWNSTEIYLYLLLNDLPLNQAYRNGLSRVGCAICPYSSGWSEDLCGYLFPQTISPFVEKLRDNLKADKIQGVDNYIKLGQWKSRAGGRNKKTNKAINITSISPVFCASITNGEVDPIKWMSVLGKLKGTTQDDSFNGEILIRGHIHKFSIKSGDSNNKIISIDQIDPNDVVLIGHLKRVMYKSTYCVHCEVCEVECPTGALSVVPSVYVDETKCIHCLKCLEFHEKGCMAAKSAGSVNDNILNNKDNIMASKSKTGIDHYRDGMGLRQIWLERYFNTYETFFDDDTHGLNVKYQLPPFINWIREAGILNMEDKHISEMGKLLASKYSVFLNPVWEIVFVNLCYNSEICNWFHSNIQFNKVYSREEMDVILQGCFPDLMDRTLRNPFNSLLNTFKESPLGKDIPVGVQRKEKNKPLLVRQPHNDLSLVAVAYSLYRYAESVGRWSLTVSEFYNENQREGIYRQFGIERDVLERKLRSLQEEGNHVLSVELAMGLDNILLRQDLNSLDILKMLL